MTTAGGGRVPQHRRPADRRAVAPLVSAEKRRKLARSEPKISPPVEGTTTTPRLEARMTDDRIAGTAKNLGGKVQETYGTAAGDVGSQAKGKLRQAEGAM